MGWVGAGGVEAELHDRHEQRHHDGDDAVGHGGRVDVGADRPRELVGGQPLGADLAQLGQRRDVEHSAGDLGLEAGEQAAGQGMPVDGADQCAEQRLLPVGQAGLLEHARQRLVDDGGGVLVDRGQEQRLLAGEVGVGDRAADGRVAGDVGDRRGAVTVAPEAHDGGVEDVAPGELALARYGRWGHGHQADEVTKQKMSPSWNPSKSCYRR